jgi:hypothetical protein
MRDLLQALWTWDFLLKVAFLWWFVGGFKWAWANAHSSPISDIPSRTKRRAATILVAPLVTTINLCVAVSWFFRVTALAFANSWNGMPQKQQEGE